MITLVFDVESTGLPSRGLPFDHPTYPHVVQIAGVLYDDGIERSSFDLIVMPDGWTVPAEAARVHGITTELAMSVGVPLRVAIAAFTNLRRRADEVWGHNVEFDVGMVKAALGRCGGDPGLIDEAPAFSCTANAATPVCQLPPTERMKRAGFGANFKRPSLSELYAFLFGGIEDFENAHSALADTRAAARCLFELRRRGHVA